MELMWGWLVIITALAVVVPVVWFCFPNIGEIEDSDTPNTPPTRTGGSAEETQIIHVVEPIVVDVRPIERAPVVDELGPWCPWDFEPDQPVLLGQILMAGEWATLDAGELGMVAA